MHHMSDILQRKQHPFYRQELKELLRQLGLEWGDTIMLHASLRAFGYLIGGAETIIEALLSTLGPEGTLGVMPSQTVGHSNPRFWQYPPAPREWHEKICDSILPYDPERTPVDQELGQTAVYFSRFPNVRRSAHPLYSFCAYGAGAEQIVRDHPLDYGLDRSPRCKSSMRGIGKNLLLGTTFETNTSLHLAEYFANRPDIEESAPILVDGEKQWVSFKNIDLDIFVTFWRCSGNFSQNALPISTKSPCPTGRPAVFGCGIAWNSPNGTISKKGKGQRRAGKEKAYAQRIYRSRQDRHHPRVRGEVKLYPWCDDPEMFLDIETIYLDAKGQKPLALEGVRFVKNMPLLKIEGVNSIDEAAKLRDKIIYIHRDDIPMEEGEYLIQDLMGLQVVDADDGHLYGELTQVSPTGANDVYHIRFADGKERLIPAIPQVVIEVDLDGGVMKIRPLEGLFDDED